MWCSAASASRWHCLASALGVTSWKSLAATSSSLTWALSVSSPMLNSRVEAFLSLQVGQGSCLLAVWRGTN